MFGYGYGARDDEPLLGGFSPGLEGRSNLSGLASLVQQGSSGLGNSGGFWNALLGATAMLGISEFAEFGPDENGWYDYLYHIPPDRILLQFENEISRWVGYVEDHDPMFNIAGLYWRYTGIGRHQMEPPEAVTTTNARKDQILFYQYGEFMPTSVTVSPALPNTTAVYTGKKPKAKTKNKAKK